MDTMDYYRADINEPGQSKHGQTGNPGISYVSPYIESDHGRKPFMTSPSRPGLMTEHVRAMIKTTLGRSALPNLRARKLTA